MTLIASGEYVDQFSKSFASFKSCCLRKFERRLSFSLSLSQAIIFED